MIQPLEAGGALGLFRTGRTFELRFGADVERLNNPGVDRRDHVHGAIQVSIGNPGFPCVRKASFDSRLTIAHHGHGQAHEDLLAFAQIGHRMRIAVELPEISPITHSSLLMLR
jgi:hypothetical protein